MTEDRSERTERLSPDTMFVLDLDQWLEMGQDVRMILQLCPKSGIAIVFLFVTTHG